MKETSNSQIAELEKRLDRTERERNDFESRILRAGTILTDGMVDRLLEKIKALHWMLSNCKTVLAPFAAVAGDGSSVPVDDDFMSAAKQIKDIEQEIGSDPLEPPAEQRPRAQREWENEKGQPFYTPSNVVLLGDIRLAQKVITRKDEVMRLCLKDLKEDGDAGDPVANLVIQRLTLELGRSDVEHIDVQSQQTITE